MSLTSGPKTLPRKQIVCEEKDPEATANPTLTTTTFCTTLIMLLQVVASMLLIAVVALILMFSVLFRRHRRVCKELQALRRSSGRVWITRTIHSQSDVIRPPSRMYRSRSSSVGTAWTYFGMCSILHGSPHLISDSQAPSPQYPRLSMMIMMSWLLP